MAISKIKLLNAVTATGAGASHKLTEQRRNLTYPIVIHGITTATVVIEASFDGTNWVPVTGGTITADSGITLDVPFPFMRANVTSYTSGTITAWLGV